jgi:predicted nucleic acid-binding Zn ribbon protein
MKPNFDMADKFFREFLRKTTGMKTRDQKRREERAKGSQPFEKGRDPVKASASLEGLISNFSWNAPLEKAALFNSWSEVVGPESAAASTPEGLHNSVLTVKCRSTAWATQLRMLETEILEKIKLLYPTLEITQIRFLGPNAPSWKKGPRSVPGRGPRDTYG